MNKKIITLITLTIILATALTNAEEITSIYEDPQFEEINPLFQPFTIATAETKNIDVGQSIIIAADERANQACNNARLELVTTDPQNKKTGQYIITGIRTEIGTQLAKTFRWTPLKEGDYKFEARIICTDNTQTISKTSTLNIQVGKPTTCTEQYISKPYCDDTTNTVIRRYQNCPSEIITNKITDNCEQKGLSCYQGSCITLQQEQKVCNSGQTVREYCQDEKTIRAEICSSSGLDINLKDTKCSEGKVCYQAQCTTPETINPPTDPTITGICCSYIQGTSLGAKYYPENPTQKQIINNETIKEIEIIKEIQIINNTGGEVQQITINPETQKNPNIKKALGITLIILGIILL